MQLLHAFSSVPYIRFYSLNIALSNIDMIVIGFLRFSFLIISLYDHFFGRGFGPRKCSNNRDKASLLSFRTGTVSEPHHALVDWNSPLVFVFVLVRCNKARDQYSNLLDGNIAPNLVYFYCGPTLGRDRS